MDHKMNINLPAEAVGLGQGTGNEPLRQQTRIQPKQIPDGMVRTKDPHVAKLDVARLIDWQTRIVAQATSLATELNKATGTSLGPDDGLDEMRQVLLTRHLECLYRIEVDDLQRLFDALDTEGKTR